MTAGPPDAVDAVDDVVDAVDVVVVSTVHPAEDPRIAVRTIGALVDAGLSVRHVCRDAPPAVPLAPATPVAGPRLVRLVRAAWLVWRCGARVVSLHDPELFPLGAALAASGRARVVLDVHEDLPARAGRTAPLVRAALRWLEARTTITLAEASYADAFAGSPTVLPNHPDYRTFPSLPRRRPPEDAPIVYVGDVTVSRGALDLVEAMRGVGRPLLLVGRCAPSLAADLERAAAASGVRLVLRGWQRHDVAMRLVAGAAVGVSPLRDTANYRRSLPTKVLEYLASGVPAVASDLPGTRAAVGDQPGVTLVPPADAGALRSAIRDALSEAAQRRAADGAAAVRASYRWPAPIVAGLYRELAAR